MSAAAETTTSGGKTVAGDNSHTSQSYDTITTTDNMAQTSDASSTQDTSARNTTVEAISVEPSSSNDPPAGFAKPTGSHEPSQGETSIAVPPPPPSSSPSPSKGKAKEDDAPAPPSKDDRRESIMAIGPAQDEIKAAPGGPDSGPVCNITLLLQSGSRHPYRIDAKYLARRNVTIPDMDDDGHPDPFSISIYTLKELILREWRSDWDAKPASPSSIRLIHFGKLLDDKEKIKKYQLSPENPNVVHMSIRPQDLDEEEPKSGSKSLPTGHSDGDGVREGRCCVIL